MKAPHRQGLVALVAALVVLGGLAAACGGNGDKAAPQIDILTPSTQPSGKRIDARTSTATPSVSPSTKPSASASASPSASPSATPKPPTDAAIKRGILARLGAEPGLRNVNFKVIVQSGVVTIAGRVRTKDQKHLAEQICLTERGVVKVLSVIEVSAASGY